MRFVLIDTQVFESKGFNFGHSDFEALGKLVEAGRVKVLLADVIDREIKQHVAAYAAEAVRQLQTVVKKNSLLRKLDGIDAGKITDKGLPEYVAKARVAEWNAWKSANKVEMIPNDVDVSAIIDDYFECRPPFGTGDKKHEFPDALWLRAAVSWCQSSGEMLHIFSGDGDTREFCKGHAQLTHEEALAPFLERLSDAYIVSKIKEGLESLEGEICQNVDEYIENEVDFYSREVDGLIVNHLKLPKTYIDDFHIVLVEDGLAVVDIRVQVECVVDVTYDDPYVYGPDDDRGRTIDETVRHVEAVNLSVMLIYDVGDPTELSFESMEFDTDSIKLPIDLTDGNPLD